MPASPPCHFLAIEDDENDAFLVKRAFIKSSRPVTAFICRNVPEAKAYLSCAGMYADEERFPRSDVIISDLHMPGGDGLELLVWVRDQPELQKIPFIIMTGSSNQVEQHQILERGATKVVQKPPTIPELTKLIDHFADEWCAPGSFPATGSSEWAPPSARP
jgi:CheY-like chemotaxis protein